MEIKRPLPQAGEGWGEGGQESENAVELSNSREQIHQHRSKLLSLL